MSQNINKIGIVALALSCVSLIMAIVPSYIIENKVNELEKFSYDKGEPVSFEIKGIKLSFSKNEKNEKADTNALKIEKLKRQKQKFTIGLYVTGVLSIFLGIYALSSKRNLRLSIGSILTASIALTWQYIATGISIGIAIVVAIFILANMS